MALVALSCQPTNNPNASDKTPDGKNVGSSDNSEDALLLVIASSLHMSERDDVAR